jgi:hypothetical protein
LWWWYINIIITVLDIIHHPVFYLKHDVLETGLCLCLQAEPSQLNPIDRPSLHLRVEDYNYIQFCRLIVIQQLLFLQVLPSLVYETVLYVYKWFFRNLKTIYITLVLVSISKHKYFCYISCLWLHNIDYRMCWCIYRAYTKEWCGFKS